MSKSSFDTQELGAVLDRLTTTGCVVTTIHDGRRDGCFVGFVAPCSLHPLRLLVCTSHENLTHALIERSGVLAVHIVGREQAEWVTHFGEQSGRETDKLAGLAWHDGVTGVPILDEALGWIEGRVIASLDCGDHTARLVEPVAAHLCDREVVPLTTFEVLARGLKPPHVPPPFPWCGFAAPSGRAARNG
jgi:flavin reductase (DIM6/NTAB) family NADH-FMN oxidoreductase RutF